MFSKTARLLRAGVLSVFGLWVFAAFPLCSAAAEMERLTAIFPMAKKFVERRVSLTAENVASIEKDLGAALLAADREPIFYIPISGEKKPLGLALFAGVTGPRGLIQGGVGVDMKGKIVKVALYEHKETPAIADAAFLEQFAGMGIEAAFTVGADIDPVAGAADASAAAALLPKKTLVMGYALFGKSKGRQGNGTTPAAPAPPPNAPEMELPEVDDLKALMALMLEDYFVVLDYFEEKGEKADAVTAARRLAQYTKLIADFEPPKNADQTEEYAYLQNKFSETLLTFAAQLQQEGITDETRAQWEAIVALINQSHLRFSEAEIDLDSY